jgi:hypothetical protein
MRTAVVAIGLTLALCTGASTQSPSRIDALMTRVGERISEFYRRVQNVVCLEKSTVQDIGSNLVPEGFARIVESELRVEAEAVDGDTEAEAKVVREIRRVNGRPPRENDKKSRAGCTDPNPLSTEPLAFLLPAHRSEYEFVHAGSGRDRNRDAVLIDFATVNRKSNLQLKEDPKGREGCYEWSGDVPLRGRIWVDATTYDVVRVDQRLRGPADLKVAAALQRRSSLAGWVALERYDMTIRYKTIAFSDPEEAMLLPESIEELLLLKGGLASSRRTKTFSEYRRFLTGGRIVK